MGFGSAIGGRARVRGTGRVSVRGGVRAQVRGGGWVRRDRAQVRVLVRGGGYALSMLRPAHGWELHGGLT